MNVHDISFDDATDVESIRYRLHSVDVGFDLRETDMIIAVDDEPELRVSYPDMDGNRRVVSGPRNAVIAYLEKFGFRFTIES